LVQWKGFIVESDTWERGEDLDNAKKLVNKLEGKLGTEVRRQERIEQK